jgi:hypothetical protein
VSFRGLSLNNKVSAVQIASKKTGEVFEVSNAKTRVSRLRRRVFAWSRSIKPAMTQTTRTVMVTLTYRKAWLWMPNHIRRFMLQMRKHLRGNLLAYAWVAELQERGAVHYHVILVVNRGTHIPMPDKAGWWKWGSSKIQSANSPFYIAKYTGKEYQKEGPFPKGLRMFAVWISEDLLDDSTRWNFRLSSLPSWFREILEDRPIGGRWKRSPGGGWLYEGVLYPSPYEYIGPVR